jgi:hypothetical protein
MTEINTIPPSGTCKINLVTQEWTGNYIMHGYQAAEQHPLNQSMSLGEI